MQGGGTKHTEVLTVQSSSFKTTPARRRSGALQPAPGTIRPEDFPGCESFHLPAREVDLYEGRFEFWDGRSETAWRVRDVSIQHDGPSRRLVRMVERVASLRGSRIACFGSSGLVRLDERGRKRWLMQADEVLYLHPARSQLFGTTINVDEDPLPEVVLEVDHTTDVRRRKLGIYMECGFPHAFEVDVEVAMYETVPHPDDSGPKECQDAPSSFRCRCGTRPRRRSQSLSGWPVGP